MRILIDESVPVELADELTGYEIVTVRQRQWLGLRNGVLLRVASEAGFDVLLTMDRSLPYQQNLRAIGMSVIVITRVRNRIRDLRLLFPQIIDVLAVIKPGDAIQISPTSRDSIREHAVLPIGENAPLVLPSR